MVAATTLRQVHFIVRCVFFQLPTMHHIPNCLFIRAHFFADLSPLEAFSCSILWAYYQRDSDNRNNAWHWTHWLSPLAIPIDGITFSPFSIIAIIKIDSHRVYAFVCVSHCMWRRCQCNLPNGNGPSMYPHGARRLSANVRLMAVFQRNFESPIRKLKHFAQRIAKCTQTLIRYFSSFLCWLRREIAVNRFFSY